MSRGSPDEAGGQVETDQTWRHSSSLRAIFPSPAAREYDIIPFLMDHELTSSVMAFAIKNHGGMSTEAFAMYFSAASKVSEQLPNLTDSHLTFIAKRAVAGGRLIATGSWSCPQPPNTACELSPDCTKRVVTRDLRTELPELIAQAALSGDLSGNQPIDKMISLIDPQQKIQLPSCLKLSLVTSE